MSLSPPRHSYSGAPAPLQPVQGPWNQPVPPHAHNHAFTHATHTPQQPPRHQYVEDSPSPRTLFPAVTGAQQSPMQEHQAQQRQPEAWELAYQQYLYDWAKQQQFELASQEEKQEQDQQRFYQQQRDEWAWQQQQQLQQQQQFQNQFHPSPPPAAHTGRTSARRQPTASAAPSHPIPDRYSTFEWIRKHDLEAQNVLRGELIGVSRRPRNGREIEGEVDDPLAYWGVTSRNWNDDSTVHDRPSRATTARMLADYTRAPMLRTARSPSPKRAQTSRMNHRRHRSPVRGAGARGRSATTASAAAPVNGGYHSAYSDNEGASTERTLVPHGHDESAPAYMRSTFSHQKQLEIASTQIPAHKPVPPPHAPGTDTGAAGAQVALETAQERDRRFRQRSRRLKAKLARISAGKTLDRKKELLEAEQAQKEEKVTEYNRKHSLAQARAKMIGATDDEALEHEDETLAAATSGSGVLVLPSAPKALATLPTTALAKELEQIRALEAQLKRELAKRGAASGEENQLGTDAEGGNATEEENALLQSENALASGSSPSPSPPQNDAARLARLQSLRTQRAAETVRKAARDEAERVRAAAAAEEAEKESRRRAAFEEKSRELALKAKERKDKLAADKAAEDAAKVAAEKQAQLRAKRAKEAQETERLRAFQQRQKELKESGEAVPPSVIRTGSIQSPSSLAKSGSGTTLPQQKEKDKSKGDSKPVSPTTITEEDAEVSDAHNAAIRLADTPQAAAAVAAAALLSPKKPASAAATKPASKPNTSNLTSAKAAASSSQGSAKKKVSSTQRPSAAPTSSGSASSSPRKPATARQPSSSSASKSPRPAAQSESEQAAEKHALASAAAAALLSKSPQSQNRSIPTDTQLGSEDLPDSSPPLAPTNSVAHPNPTDNMDSLRSSELETVVERPVEHAAPTVADSSSTAKAPSAVASTVPPPKASSADDEAWKRIMDEDDDAPKPAKRSSLKLSAPLPSAVESSPHTHPAVPASTPAVPPATSSKKPLDDDDFDLDDLVIPVYNGPATGKKTDASTAAAAPAKAASKPSSKRASATSSPRAVKVAAISAAAPVPSSTAAAPAPPLAQHKSLDLKDDFSFDASLDGLDSPKAAAPKPAASATTAAAAPATTAGPTPAATAPIVAAPAASKPAPAPKRASDFELPEFDF